MFVVVPTALILARNDHKLRLRGATGVGDVMSQGIEILGTTQMCQKVRQSRL